MAYGEHGKDIEDVPTQRRPPPKEMAPEKEVDRFDESKHTLNVDRCLLKQKTNKQKKQMNNSILGLLLAVYSHIQSNLEG